MFWRGWSIARRLLVANLIFIGVGFAYFEETGYSSGTKLLGVSQELWGGVLILISSVGLFVFRRIYQDRRPFTWTEPDDGVPSGEPASPAVQRAPNA